MAEEIIDPNKGLIDMPDLAGSEVCKNLWSLSQPRITLA